MTVSDMKKQLEKRDDDENVVAMFAHGDAGMWYDVSEVTGLDFSDIDEDGNDIYEEYCLIIIDN